MQVGNGSAYVQWNLWCDLDLRFNINYIRAPQVQLVFKMSRRSPTIGIGTSTLKHNRYIESKQKSSLVPSTLADLSFVLYALLMNVFLPGGLSWPLQHEREKWARGTVLHQLV
jgi:hypothetical protein